MNIFVCADSVRVRRQVPQGQQQGYAQQQSQVQYRPFNQAPAQIKQLLQFQQAREPLVHIPAGPPPNLGPARQGEPQLQSQTQAVGYRPQVQYGNAPQQPTYKNQAAAIAAQYRPQGQPQYNQQQYRPQQQPQYNQQQNNPQGQFPQQYRPQQG